ncbi:hypothetical protein VNO77_03447 [Canavalia gladiata]|uniref:Uncharacterized protein n=1 Tax=Canavalia gladiata TaxID=3824 RepID=A0AAN9MUQ4_CANGL
MAQQETRFFGANTGSLEGWIDRRVEVKKLQFECLAILLELVVMHGALQDIHLGLRFPVLRLIKVPRTHNQGRPCRLHVNGLSRAMQKLGKYCPAGRAKTTPMPRLHMDIGTQSGVVLPVMLQDGPLKSME